MDSFRINYPNCTQINGSFNVEGLDITNLDSLYEVEVIGGKFAIENTSIVFLNGMDSLHFLGDGLAIVGNNSLDSIHGFINLQHCLGGSMEITNNQNLQLISGFEGLTGFLDGFWATDNQNLTKISGFNGVTSCAGINLESCAVLDTFEGFNALDSLSEEIIMEQCALCTCLA